MHMALLIWAVWVINIFRDPEYKKPRLQLQPGFCFKELSGMLTAERLVLF